MLLIDCPYCNMARPEIEFAYGGEAHMARPADPSLLSDQAMGELPLFSLESQGRAGRALATRPRLRAILQLPARHVERQDHRGLQGGRASAGRRKRTRRAKRMSQPFRLAGGGSIDRSRPLVFTFDGLDYQGYAGDTLASALIANGVHLTGRSFKYHRPRGISVRRRRGAERAREPPPRARPSHPKSACNPDRALRSPSRFKPEIAGRRSPSTLARSTTWSRRCSARASTTRPSWARTCSARTGHGSASTSP